MAVSYTYFSLRAIISLLRPLEPSIEREKRRPRPPADAAESLRCSYFSPFISLPRKSSDRRVACLVFVRPPLLSTTQQVYIGSATPLCAADKGRWQSLHRAFHLSIIIYFGEWTRPALPRSLVYKNKRLFGPSSPDRASPDRLEKERRERARARERETARVVARWHVPRFRIAKGRTFATTAALARVHEQSRPEVWHEERVCMRTPPKLERADNRHH